LISVWTTRSNCCLGKRFVHIGKKIVYFSVVTYVEWSRSLSLSLRHCDYCSIRLNSIYDYQSVVPLSFLHIHLYIHHSFLPTSFLNEHRHKLYEFFFILDAVLVSFVLLSLQLLWSQYHHHEPPSRHPTTRIRKWNLNEMLVKILFFFRFPSNRSISPPRPRPPPTTPRWGDVYQFLIEIIFIF
jgi:hypothetical protein